MRSRDSRAEASESAPSFLPPTHSSRAPWLASRPRIPTSRSGSSTSRSPRSCDACARAISTWQLCSACGTRWRTGAISPTMASTTCISQTTPTASCSRRRTRSRPPRAPTSRPGRLAVRGPTGRRVPPLPHAARPALRPSRLGAERRHEVNDVTVARAFVAAGLGVAVLPELALPPPHQDVAVRPVRDAEPFRSIHATWLRNRRVPAVAHMVRYLADAATARLG